MKKQEKQLVDMLETALRSKNSSHSKPEDDDESIPWDLVHAEHELYSEEELEAIHTQFANEAPIEFPPDFEETEDEETMPEQNLDLHIENDVLRITIDLKKTQGISRSGRSIVISSTFGNLQLFDKNGLRGEILNLSVSRRLPKAKPVRFYPVR